MEAISALRERRPYPLGPRVAQVRCCISPLLLPGSWKRPPQTAPPLHVHAMGVCETLRDAYECRAQDL